MAKQTRIPELVVGKIYIDGGDKEKVYTIGSDEDGALRIGDSKSNMVATIDQRTGKIVANSFAGDGSALAGISAEGLADLQTARLLTLSADKLFFNYDADGVAKVTNPAQTITLTAKTQNIENPTFNWYSNEITPVASGDNGELLVIDLNQMGNNEFVTVTVEVDNESLSESTTIFRLQEGRTGRDAVTVAMVNPTVTYQATLVDGDTPDIPEDDAAFMAAGEANITVRYGATKLTPVTGTPGDNEFTVTVASSEYVTVPTDPSYIAPDTANKKMDIGAPANVIAQVGTITFDVTAQVDGETYSFTQIQNFNLNVPGQVGATGEGAKFVKLTSNDYQFAYNSDGLQASPAFVTLTADAQNHGDAIYYRWFVDDVPWEPGTTGTAISPTPTQHLYTTTNSIRLNAASSHNAYGFKKIVRVETQTTDDGDPIASDSVSVIATKDGSNAIQIAADNLTHGFPANPDGTIDSEDYDDGAITFQVYHGNTNMTPNMTVVGSLKTLIQGTSIGSSPTQNSINNIVASLQNGEFAVLADATTATVDGANVNTIDPFGSAPQSVTDAAGDEGLKFFPNNMQTTLRRAAINYTFYLRTADGQLAASTVRTQTFVKGRDGAQGLPGTPGTPGLPGTPGIPGVDASATKLLLNDYQVGFDENGSNPQTFAGDGTVTATLTVQGIRINNTFFRVYLDDVLQDVQNPQGAPWETYKWRRAPSGYSSYQFDFSDNTYDTDWSSRKKVVKIEVTEIDYTYDAGTDTYTIDSEDINGDPQDVTNLPVLAQDSETIIATKEGSNAVEVTATNLSHQFIESTTGNIDYSKGGIAFSVYIGNTPLTAHDGTGGTTWENEGANTFRVINKGTSNIDASTTRTADGGRLTFDPPTNMTENNASITWGVQVKDSTGAERPERELVQSFTKARDGSDSKLIRIDASSRVFSFESAYDYQADPSEIIFSVPSQNLAEGEEIDVDDIIFLDKDGTDVSSRVKSYVNPPVNSETQTTEQQITAQLAQGNTFTMRFAQFQSLAKDDNGSYFPVGTYQDPNGDTVENVVPVLQQLKKTAFPLTVRVHKTGLAGAVSSIMDEVRLLSLEGGSSAISIDAPNAMHLFDANADMEVDNGQESRDAAGTDIDVYIGTTLLEYDTSATSLSTLEPGKYRFGDFIYGTKTGTGSGGNMLTLAVRSDHTGIEVTNISSDYTKQTITLPVQVKRTDGMEETKNLILSYSKVKEGRDGENLKDRNFDFSQGPTGWSLDNTADKGADLPLTHMKIKTDDKATFGGNVGKFMGSEFQDTNNFPRTNPIWISEALPVGGTPGAAEDENIDEGVWVIKFRARAPDSAAAIDASSSSLRAWLLIKPFAADGTAYPNDYNSAQVLYFNSLPDTSTGYTTEKTFFNGVIKITSDEAQNLSFSDLSVPIMTTHYVTYVARVTPADIRELMGAAASFKIGFMYEDSDMDSYADAERIGLHVDAFQAEKLPYSSLVGFDSEQFNRIQNNKLLSEQNFQNRAADKRKDDFEERDGVLEDMSSLSNYNFFSKYDNGFPSALLPSVWSSNGSLEPDYTDDFPTVNPSKIWLWDSTTLSGITDGNAAVQIVYSEDFRRSLTFPALLIPAQNFKIKLKIRYKTGQATVADWANDSSTTGPLIRLYFSEELGEGKKYIGTQDTNYSFGEGESLVHRRSSNNVVKTIKLDPKLTWSTREETVTLYEDSIGSSFNNKTGDLKYFSISLFPGSSASRDHDLYVDYIDCEIEPPVNFAEMDKTRSDALTPWENTTPEDERTAAVTLTKGDSAIAPWVTTNPTAERAAARAGALADVKADSDIAPWVATTPGDLKTETKDDTFGDNRFTTVDTKAQQGIDDAAAADTKAINAQTAAGVADSKATGAQTAAAAADTKAQQGVDDAAAAQADADTANAGVQLVKNTQEDMTVQSSAAVNGRFSVLDDAGKAPAGISLLNFGNGTNVGGYTREDQTSWEVESNNTDGQYLRMKGATNRRRGILLPFASIPENHFVEVTIKYKGGDSNQTSEGPLWRVYSTSDEVDQEEYTHLFPDNNEWYAEDGAKIYKHANVDWQGEKFDEKTSWTTLTFKAGFDWEENPPKYCSIALMTAWSTGTANNRDLLIKYVDVTFKKASYRSGETYPTDIVAQKGDQFFQVTTADDYGYLSTYGKAIYDFGVAAVLPSNYAWSSASGWPFVVSSRWTRSNDSSTHKVTVQPVEVIDSFNFSTQTFIYRTEYYLSTTSANNRYAYIKRKFFGPHKIIMHYVPIHRKADGKVIAGSSAIDVMFDHTNSNNQFNSSATTTSVDTTIRTKLDGGSWTDRKTASKNTYDTSTGASYIQTLTYENLTNTKSFEISLKLDGYGDNGGCFAVKRLEVITFSPTVDERTETGLYELAEDLNGSITTFTGQHKCVLTGSNENIDGLIVSSTGKYDNMNYSSHEHRFKVNPQEAVPVVCKTDTQKDKKVLGVVNGIWHKAAFNTRFLTDGIKEDYTPRYEINSLGEGGIWVSNIAGDLENGDYICSSNIPGYGMKQDDDILRNYTVAKITQDCTFDLESVDYDCKEVEHDGIVYKVAFVGCTYHCG